MEIQLSQPAGAGAGAELGNIKNSGLRLFNTVCTALLRPIPKIVVSHLHSCPQTKIVVNRPHSATQTNIVQLTGKGNDGIYPPDILGFEKTKVVLID